MFTYKTVSGQVLEQAEDLVHKWDNLYVHATIREAGKEYAVILAIDPNDGAVKFSTNFITQWYLLK